MNNRLKLYDDLIYTYIEPKDKIKLRQIAFKHKKSVSEFTRCIIKIIIKLDELNALDSKRQIVLKNITNLINLIGRNE